MTPPRHELAARNVAHMATRTRSDTQRLQAGVTCNGRPDQTRPQIEAEQRQPRLSCTRLAVNRPRQWTFCSGMPIVSTARKANPVTAGTSKPCNAHASGGTDCMRSCSRLRSAILAMRAAY